MRVHRMRLAVVAGILADVALAIALPSHAPAGPRMILGLAVYGLVVAAVLVVTYEPRQPDREVDLLAWAEYVESEASS